VLPAVANRAVSSGFASDSDTHSDTQSDTRGGGASSGVSAWGEATLDLAAADGAELEALDAIVRRRLPDGAQARALKYPPLFSSLLYAVVVSTTLSLDAFSIFS
jgi:hypothetical protein